MQSFQCSGPIGLYVGLGAGLAPGANAGLALLPGGAPPAGVVRLPVQIETGLPVFLGTAERGVRAVFVQHFKEIVVDQYGSAVPLDLLWDSEEAWVYAELTRWSEPVLTAVQARMYKSGDVGSPMRGWDGNEDVGTLMKAEGKGCYALWLSFSYARKPAMALAGMPPSVLFPAAVAYGPDEYDPLGTRARKVRLVWRALRLTGDGKKPASVLYWNDPTPLPSSG